MTMIAMTSTTLLTTMKSRQDCRQHIGPQPRSWKICSTMTEPARRCPMRRPRIVSAGSDALRNACLPITRAGLRPRASAALM